MADVTTEEFVAIGGTTTSVLKCGDLSENNTLVLIIPGNPGVALYYKEFMRVLHEASGRRLPVWCVSHAGHGSVPDFKSSGDPFSLQGQIQHKVTFIREHVPKDTRLLLIGHSIGCYIILHMLKELDPARILKSLLLFPTIERLAVTDKGRWATPLLKYLRWMSSVPMYPVQALPSRAKQSILKWYFKGRPVHDFAVEATLRLANAASVRHVARMANEEMQDVVKADHDIIEKHLERLMFYYGSRDHWCPVTYYEDMKARFPGGDIELCTRGYAHAFVLEDSLGMAQYLWQWLLGKVKDLS